MPGTVVVTGAGISVGAGIKPYRDEFGQELTPGLEHKSHVSRYGMYFEEMWEHWLQLYQVALSAEPSKAHLFIAEMGWPVITTNVDGLHQHAGSMRVLEVHGTVASSTCKGCRKSFDTVRLCPYCGSGRTRPDIVLFGENLKREKEARNLIAQADEVIYVGMSGQVEPVASWHLLNNKSRTLVLPSNRWGNFDTHHKKTADEWSAELLMEEVQ